MPSITVAKGTHTVSAVGPAPVPNGPAHLALKADGNSKGVNYDLVRLAMADVTGFTAGQSVTVDDTNPTDLTVNG